MPSVEALTPVAEFFARRNFTVASRTRVAGLQLRADDGPFAAGSGPSVTGSTLTLVMSMAGRAAYLAELAGPGVPLLRSRLEAGVATPTATGARPGPARSPRPTNPKEDFP